MGGLHAYLQVEKLWGKRSQGDDSKAYSCGALRFGFSSRISIPVDVWQCCCHFSTGTLLVGGVQSW